MVGFIVCVALYAMYHIIPSAFFRSAISMLWKHDLSYVQRGLWLISVFFRQIAEVPHIKGFHLGKVKGFQRP